MGFITASEAIADPLAKFAADTYINSNFFNQAIVYDCIRRGWLDENLATLKKLYRPRLDAMLTALDDNFKDLATWHKPDGGFFIGMTLMVNIQPEKLLKRASEANLELSDGRGFFCNGGGNFVRLPFCALTPEEIQIGSGRKLRFTMSATHRCS